MSPQVSALIGFPGVFAWTLRVKLIGSLPFTLSVKCSRIMSFSENPKQLDQVFHELEKYSSFLL